MKEKLKTYEKLIEELKKARKRNAELEAWLCSCGMMGENMMNSHCKLAALIENLPGMGYACLNDKKWTMQFVSKGCIELTGYKPEDFIGNQVVSYNELIHPDDRGHVWEQVQEALVKREKFHLLYRIHTAFGEIKWVWEHGAGIFSEEGKLLSLQGFIQAMAA